MYQKLRKIAENQVFNSVTDITNKMRVFGDAFEGPNAVSRWNEGICSECQAKTRSPVVKRFIERSCFA
jgi:hypothetical protein